MLTHTVLAHSFAFANMLKQFAFLWHILGPFGSKIDSI